MASWIQRTCEQAVGARRVKQKDVDAIVLAFDDDPCFRYMDVREICDKVARLGIDISKYLSDKQIPDKLASAVSCSIEELNRSHVSEPSSTKSTRGSTHWYPTPPTAMHRNLILWLKLQKLQAL